MVPRGGGRGGGRPRAGGRGTVWARAAHQGGARQPPRGPRAHPSVPVPPCAPQHDAARHLAGMRVCLAPRAARGASRPAAQGTPDAPSRGPTAHGMAQTTPASAGAGLLPAAAGATARPRPLLWRARALARAHPLLPWGHGRYVSRAQPAGRQAEERHGGAVAPRPRPRQESASAYDGGSTSERVCLTARLGTAEARTTAEPDAGKLHVRDCTGGAGQPAFLP